MKKLAIISRIVLLLTVICFILWRFVVHFPDWLIRVICVITMISIFTVTFTAVKLAANKK